MLIINLSLVLLAFAEINAYICNAIRWGTDPFVIDIFKINFSKTTMGISKKTEILQTTENSEPTEILKANDCARALAKNLTASNKLAVKGEALLKAIDKTDIPDKMLEEIKKVSQRCAYTWRPCQRIWIIVLIVSLWNWNLFPNQVIFRVLIVLIVPLWNWNIWAVNIWRCERSF